MGAVTQHEPEPARGAGLRWAAPLVLVMTATGLLIFGHKYLDELANGRPGHFWPTLVEEMTGAYTIALLIPLAVVVARRWPLVGPSWARHLPVHVLALLAFSAAHTTLMYATRSVIFPLVGFGTYDYGILPIRYAMEMPSDVIGYCLTVGLSYMFDRYREFRDREVRTAQLEARLSEARLDALRLQLDPHFLFNTLNTISSVVYEDPRAADEMISKLSELLRASLGGSGAQEVALDEELRILDLYVDLMRGRFGENLSVRVDVDAEARRALVPSMVLQPLVENAIRHGVDPETSRVDVEVCVGRRGQRLVLDVRDRGPGIDVDPGEVAGRGIGLTNTANRIAQLYGEGHDLTLDNADGGGLRVRVTIPYRAARAAVAG